MPAPAQPDSAESPDSSTSEFDFDVTFPGKELPQMAIRWGGFQLLPVGAPANEHVHFRYGFIILVTAGQGKFSCGDQSWKLQPGVVFWAAPNLTTCFEMIPDSAAVEHFVVMPFGSEVAAWFRNHLGTDVGAAPVYEFQSTCRLFQAIMDEGLGGGEHREANCLNLVQVLIRRLESQLATGRNIGRNARATFVRARKYIQQNYAVAHDLGDIASAIDLSVPYLCRLFEHHDKTSAFDFLTRLKLSKAERLLCTGELSIRKVGESVGYTDLQLFSRNFKNKYGISPRNYRKAHQSHKSGTIEATPNISDCSD